MNPENTILEAAMLLEAAGIDNGRQEARWLMSQLLCEIPPCSVPCPADPPEWLLEEFQKRLRRRLDGEPLQYIMGSVEFFNVELLVGPGVLIPRPETEQLVELALKHITGNTVCDLCTGSGAIAIAIAKERPDTTVTGVDISPKALEFAQRNKERLAVNNATFLLGDLFGPLPQGSRFSLITANPPYVSAAEYDRLEPVVHDYEPSVALLGGEDGLDIIRRIADSARQFLSPGGTLISEIGEEQGPGATEIFRAKGFENVATAKDYSGKDRFIVAVNS